MALPQGTPTLELDRGGKRHLHLAANERGSNGASFDKGLP